MNCFLDLAIIMGPYQLKFVFEYATSKSIVTMADVISALSFRTMSFVQKCFNMTGCFFGLANKFLVVHIACIRGFIVLQ